MNKKAHCHFNVIKAMLVVGDGGLTSQFPSLTVQAQSSTSALLPNPPSSISPLIFFNASQPPQVRHLCCFQPFTHQSRWPSHSSFLAFFFNPLSSRVLHHSLDAKLLRTYSLTLAGFTSLFPNDLMMSYPTYSTFNPLQKEKIFNTRLVTYPSV